MNNKYIDFAKKLNEATDHELRRKLQEDPEYEALSDFAITFIEIPAVILAAETTPLACTSASFATGFELGLLYAHFNGCPSTILRAVKLLQEDSKP